MFYAKNNASHKIDLYLALLDKSINEGSKSNYWSFFQNAFTEAHLLATGAKTHFNVANEWYDVVSLLVKDNLQYFRNLDVQDINQQVFNDVKTFMHSMKQSNSKIDG